ncbi:MAG: cytochrome d ubiquinol oxidase subunit II [Methylocystis sp.]
MFDYMMLRLIWWTILGVLLIGFAVMDGFDLGVAMLHPFVAKTDTQRRVVLNTIGPVWEGNQVWFILAGGATFAAWPYVYSVSFSGFYLAMMLVLVGLILRPVAISFRSKSGSANWRTTWDWIFFISGVLPSLLFGVAFGNLFVGAPFHFDRSLRVVYEGNLFGLLNPFSLLCGLVSLALLLMQGAAWLNVKADGEVAASSRRLGHRAAITLIILITVAGGWLSFGIDGYLITSQLDPTGPSNPLLKNVVNAPGGWIINYKLYPWSIAAPILAYLGAILMVIFTLAGKNRLSLVASSVSVAAVVLMAGFSLFPFIMPSSTHPDQSLTVWDASSSEMTLSLMLVATVFFLPIIFAYTAWVYSVLRGVITETAIQSGNDHYY